MAAALQPHPALATRDTLGSPTTSACFAAAAGASKPALWHAARQVATREGVGAAGPAALSLLADAHVAACRLAEGAHKRPPSLGDLAAWLRLARAMMERRAWAVRRALAEAWELVRACACVLDLHLFGRLGGAGALLPGVSDVSGRGDVKRLLSELSVCWVLWVSAFATARESEVSCGGGRGVCLLAQAYVGGLVLSAAERHAAGQVLAGLLAALGAPAPPATVANGGDAHGGADGGDSSGDMDVDGAPPLNPSLSPSVAGDDAVPALLELDLTNTVAVGGEGLEARRPMHAPCLWPSPVMWSDLADHEIVAVARDFAPLTFSALLAALHPPTHGGVSAATEAADAVLGARRRDLALAAAAVLPAPQLAAVLGLGGGGAGGPAAEARVGEAAAMAAWAAARVLCERSVGAGDGELRALWMRAHVLEQFKVRSGAP